MLASRPPADPNRAVNHLNFAIAILQGDPLSDFLPAHTNRYYEGFPVLHYTGPNKKPPSASEKLAKSKQQPKSQ
jgi:hypothetical protein